MDILQLKDILVQDVIDNNDCYHIKATITPNQEYCKKCYSYEALQRNGTKTIMYRDIPIHGKQVGIYLIFQRYYCKKCATTTYQKSGSLANNHLMTKRLVNYIFDKSYKVTFTQLALEVGVNEKTIRNVFAKNVESQLNQLRIETPVILGIDEVHLIGKPRCIIANIEQRTIVDMLKNRNKTTLMNYFTNLKDKEKIRVVAMDMWRPYFDIVSATIPHAKIVIDKFHVVKMASEAMERVRKDIRKELIQKKRIQLKNDRYLLLKRNHQLTPMERLSIESWFEQYKCLGMAYRLKENFYDIWSSQTRKEAEDAFTQWSKQIPLELIDYFSPIVSTVNNWHIPIFNYFTARYTNATTEALNGLIKILNRNGRGYSFEVLRAKMLLNHGVHKIHKSHKFNRINSDEKMMGLPYEPETSYGISIQKLKQQIIR